MLRLREGDAILVFNGRDGEWHAALVAESKSAGASLSERGSRAAAAAGPSLPVRAAEARAPRLHGAEGRGDGGGAPPPGPDAPRASGACQPRAGWAANTIEAAEQCGILSIAAVDAPAALSVLIADWPRREAGRRIVFCDEGAPRGDPLALLAPLRGAALALLVGPEGGFAEDERAMLHAAPFVTAIPLGPRILRADTAAVAALALVQAAAGDWRAEAPPSG